VPSRCRGRSPRHEESATEGGYSSNSEEAILCESRGDETRVRVETCRSHEGFSQRNTPGVGGEGEEGMKTTSAQNTNAIHSLLKSSCIKNEFKKKRYCYL